MCFRCTACASNSYKTSNPEPAPARRRCFTQVLPNPWHGVRIVNAQNILPMPPAMPGICFECSLLFCWNIIFFFVCHVGMLGWVLKTSDHIGLDDFSCDSFKGGRCFWRASQPIVNNTGLRRNWYWFAFFQNNPNLRPRLNRWARRQKTFLIPFLLSPTSQHLGNRSPKKSGKHPSLRIPQKCEFEFHRRHRADSGNKTCG